MDGRNPKILAVDDHPLTREALARLVADLGPGTEVLEADSIAAARHRLGRDPTPCGARRRLPDGPGRLRNAPSVPVSPPQDDPAMPARARTARVASSPSARPPAC
jgi:CheY-like chemotaxis protein